jgi:hypothetical protein
VMRPDSRSADQPTSATRAESWPTPLTTSR